jgi:fructokinase
MTGAVVEVLRPDRRTGHRFLFSCPACAHNVKFSNLPDRLELRAWTEQVSNFDVLFVDRATPALIELAAAARDAQVLVVFEPNRVTPGSLNERMALKSDIVKVAAPNSGLAALEGLKTRGAAPRLLVQTSGEQGLTFALRHSDADWTPPRHLPPVRSEATVDTAGAGDWCTAGLLDGLLQRSGPRWEIADVTESLRMGQALAAFSLQFVGPRGVLDHCSSGQVRRAAEQALKAGFAALKTSRGAPPKPKWDERPGSENQCPVCLSTV